MWTFYILCIKQWNSDWFIKQYSLMLHFLLMCIGKLDMINKTFCYKCLNMMLTLFYQLITCNSSEKRRIKSRLFCSYLSSSSALYSENHYTAFVIFVTHFKSQKSKFSINSKNVLQNLKIIL